MHDSVSFVSFLFDNNFGSKLTCNWDDEHSFYSSRDEQRNGRSKTPPEGKLFTKFSATFVAQFLSKNDWIIISTCITPLVSNFLVEFYISALHISFERFHTGNSTSMQFIYNWVQQITCHWLPSKTKSLLNISLRMSFSSKFSRVWDFSLLRFSPFQIDYNLSNHFHASNRLQFSPIAVATSSHGKQYTRLHGWKNIDKNMPESKHENCHIIFVFFIFAHSQCCRSGSPYMTVFPKIFALKIESLNPW